MSQRTLSKVNPLADLGLTRTAKPMSNLSGSLSTSSATSAESIESEISRLTWAVIDGTATEAQEARLAELVKSQHKRRQASPK